MWYTDSMKKLIDCAMKRTPCDLVVKGAKIFNVFTGELEEGNLGIVDGKIVGVSDCYEGKTVMDGTDKIAIPGLIDAHIHVESSLLSPEAFSSLTLPHGTTGIVADPHEITNVCGIEGAEYLAEAFARLRTPNGSALQDVYLQLPSCVPATPFETSGAIIGGKETAEEIVRPLFYGLGEMMNFPAVLAGDSEVLKKLEAAKGEGKVIDGHAPTISGDGLNAYAATGIVTDHEPTSAKECKERVARGMYVMLRNGSSAPNIYENYRAVTAFNFRRFLLCSDDKNASDLKNKGHMDDALRILVGLGVPAEWAICMATSNVAACYGLKGKGALCSGYDADVTLVNDLTQFAVQAVIKGGELVAEGGTSLVASEERYLPACVKNTVRVAPVHEEDFILTPKTGRMRAIRVIPRSLVTEEEIVSVSQRGGDVSLEGTDLLKLAVIERHFESGNLGLGLVKGYGFYGGAIAITVSHDSHNLIVLGDNNADMVRACDLLREHGGGMALVKGGVSEVFPLDIAGLMSSASVDAVITGTARLSQMAKGMGVVDGVEPFMSLAFLSLVVIPKLKLTDRGLFDLDKFSFVEIDV